MKGGAGFQLSSSLSSLLEDSTLQSQSNKTRIIELEKEIRELKSEILKKNLANEETEREFYKLRETVEELQKKQELQDLESRVNEQAAKALFEHENFLNEFLKNQEHETFVMSIDIRRSTELMLKARSPEMFAQFISSLCKDLKEVITKNYGIFDKFTGDGILAFFPEFYSGPDAGIHAVQSAIECHSIFQRKYKDHRRNFTTVLNNTGLSIGIDYGPANMQTIAGGLTVVGAPVVYACRLSGGPPGKTLLNQWAYNKIQEVSTSFLYFSEETLKIKHEEEILVYSIQPNGTEVQARDPEWKLKFSTSIS
ncbi:gll0479 [Gloeobacter violaceus PCC 7421]|uniref:Gll0479 protein n=1 Tax=Gloeobacter violaceus (strain ATCC 29082 / PCC 7421) TaxID=251221 RepID=Q7NND2_GLOVI|nr:gll0479 [Gloeobacter violaceus PCC 7421]